MRQPQTHDVKAWPESFNRICRRQGDFDRRRDDRDYQRGDTLRLREYIPDTKDFTGRVGMATVKEVVRFEDMPGWVFLGLFFRGCEVVHGAHAEPEDLNNLN